MFREVIAICGKDLRRIVRSKQELAFTLLFPLVFLLIIGFTFGGGMGERAPVVVGIVNLDSEAVQISGVTYTNDTIGNSFVDAMIEANFTVYDYTKLGDKDTEGMALYALARGNVQGVIVIPANFTECLSAIYLDETGQPTPKKGRLEVYVDKTDVNAAMIAEQSILGFISGFSQYYKEEIISLSPPEMQDKMRFFANPIETTTTAPIFGVKRLRYVDFLVPAMTGLVLLWVGLAHAAGSIPEEKDRGTFSRMTLAPISPMAILGGKALAVLVLVLASTAVLLATGVAVFQVDLYWNPHIVIPLIVLASLNSIGIGLIISSVAKDSKAANSMQIFFNLPMQFFIGAFFPLELMPEPVQVFGNLLPFTKFVAAMQKVMVRNMSVDAILGEIIYLTACGLIFLSLGVLAYKWWLKKL
jgi:ABC-2 type transport system permease protein